MLFLNIFLLLKKGEIMCLFVLFIMIQTLVCKYQKINKFIKDFRGLVGVLYAALSVCLLGAVYALESENLILTLILFGA